MRKSAIFDTAVGGYPMIKAKATTVAQRTIPGGTEYLFTAATCRVRVQTPMRLLAKSRSM